MAEILNFSNFGYEGCFINVEVDISRNTPGSEIIGVTNNLVKQSIKKVKAAIKNSGVKYPQEQVLVNLSPANAPKDDAVFDLSIAVAILSKTETLSNISNLDQRILLMGELMIEDGSIRGVSGVLNAALRASQEGIDVIVVSAENIKEVAPLQNNIKIIHAQTLRELIDHLNYYAIYNEIATNQYIESPQEINNNDFSDFLHLNGLENLKYAYQIAIAGRHNMLLYGPPGSGKTLSVKCAVSLLPKLDKKSSIEISQIYSIAGKLKDGIIAYPPFQNPYHDCTPQALTGGGKNGLTPGYVSLSHKGILYIDEALEFGKQTIQAIREPLESGKIEISRAQNKTQYPSNFMLIMSTNPCPCGNYGTKNICSCSHKTIMNYWNKIGGPVMDRIPIRIKVENDRHNESSRHTSASLMEKVEIADKIQTERFKNSNNNTYRNSDMSVDEIAKYCELNNECLGYCKNISSKYLLSKRAENQILTLARTIADTEQRESISIKDLETATSFRIIKDPVFSEMIKN